MFSDGVFRPIHVGRALADRPLDITGDDTGENISSLNPSFCELTAIFWAWKNDSDADWVGLMHYRRFLAFKPQGMLGRPEGQITHDTLSIETIETTGLNEVSVRSFLAQNPDVNAILPQIFDKVILKVENPIPKSANHRTSHVSVVLTIISSYEISFFLI